MFYPPWVICTVVSQIWFYDKLFISNNFLELLAFWEFAGVLEFEIGSQEGLICLGKQRTICHWRNNYIPAIGSDSWIAAITQTGGLSDAWVFQRDSRRRTIKEDKDSILCVLLLLLHGRVSCYIIEQVGLLSLLALALCSACLHRSLAVSCCRGVSVCSF